MTASAQRAELALTPLTVSPEILLAFWYELRGPRDQLHRRHTGPCDTELRVGGLRLGRATSIAPRGSAFHLSGHCPCRDLVADAYVLVVEFLTTHAGSLHNPPGAIRTHLRYRLADLARRARGDRGAQVKPETVSANRYGRALPDDFHREVFVMLADEAGYSTPMLGKEGLLDRLAARCGASFAGTPEEHRALLPSVLSRIEEACRSGPRVNVGTATEPELVTWWEAYVDRPLGRRPNPADVAVEDQHTGIAAPDLVTDPDDELLTSLLKTVPGRSDERAALTSAITRLRDHGLLPHTRAQLLLTDGQQQDLVLRQLRDLTRPDLKCLRHKDR
ncbi:hypothetical protein ACSHWB_34445 [Lentzea sp. HUAS TT2]|uniref:hypothetical protein n=1 Tax=Lentzea sp. HUAS TT2 TaxID=3447454 RepID=UPI003F721830